MDFDRIVMAYRNLRDAEQMVLREAEAKAKELRAKRDRLEAEMLRILNENNGEGIRTASGTFYRTEDVIPSGADWGAFYSWVKANDAFDALERRIKKTFISQYMEDNDGAVPPGVNVFRRFKVNVRKND